MSGSWFSNFFRCRAATLLTKSNPPISTNAPPPIPQITDCVSAVRSTNVNIATSIAAIIASPGFIGMFACSNADSIMLVAPRFSAADSAFRAALRRNAKREMNPLEDFESPPYAPNLLCTFADEERPLPNRMMISRKVAIPEATAASITISLPELEVATSPDCASAGDAARSNPSESASTARRLICGRTPRDERARQAGGCHSSPDVRRTQGGCPSLSDTRRTCRSRQHPCRSRTASDPGA